MNEFPSPEPSLLESSPRIACAGSVSSSYRVLQGLLRHKANVVGVLGLHPDVSAKVSGYCRMDNLAQDAGVPYADFRRINEPPIVDLVRHWQPDLLFVVGLSQLVGAELLSIPRLGCVGFHPTWLPEGRGRAPIAWLTYHVQPGAATFFLMDEGADSGPILVQEPFAVSSRDYATDVLEKAEAAIERALDRWLPRLLAGEWQPEPQNDDAATYYALRGPTDGLIQWSQSALSIENLIRASSHPHPGAYTYLGGQKLIIWRANRESELPICGVTGRVVWMDAAKGWLVQTGEGLLWLTDVELNGEKLSPSVPSPLRIGVKLGMMVEDEIQSLQQRVEQLEKQLALLSQGQASEKSGKQDN
ncbi:MAG TPA: formyltransferase family protein [Abditibacteriaceae bacterium]|jgi:methionyl-tRNA formyltransferase